MNPLKLSRNKCVLVTGGLGYIGIHTSISLIENGYKLIIVDSLQNCTLDNLTRLKKLASKNKSFDFKNLVFYKGDVRDQKLLRRVFQDAINNGNKIDYVIHFAGLKSISESIIKPNLYFDVNVNGTKKLLSIMEENNCRNLVFSSSASVYSKDEKSPLTENSKVLPENPYGDTKLKVENILEQTFQSSTEKWQIICLRYFNPIGAHESGLIGENTGQSTSNLFPLLCEVAAKKRKILFIYGRDWETPDGTGIRDYIHVMDLAEGHLAAIKYFEKNKTEKICEILNLGTGKGTSVFELITLFQKVNNIKIDFIFADRREGDKAIIYANPIKAKKILSWRPTRNLKRMCIDGWNWQQKIMQSF